MWWGEILPSFFASDMPEKRNVARVIDPSAVGQVELTAARHGIPRADHAGDSASPVRFENSHAQPDVRLVRKMDALIRRDNAREDKVSIIVQAGIEKHACECPARGRASHSRPDDRDHVMVVTRVAIQTRVHPDRETK